MEFLLSRGANVNTQNFLGNTPLHKVISRPGGDSANTIRLLLSNGADIHIQNNQGGIFFKDLLDVVDTPLLKAVRQGN
jgi:ankyrin repeat protein